MYGRTVQRKRGGQAGRAWQARLVSAVALAVSAGCAGTQVGPRGGDMDRRTLDDLIVSGARLMWVAAHPDDEALAGSILAKAGPRLHNPIFFFVLTHGEGGECLLPEGCSPDLASVRAEEMKRAAALYGGLLQHERYFNAPLPVKSFPPREEIARRWAARGDPTLEIAKAIREFAPTVVLTFDPDHGFTGHPEHQLASRFATRAVVVAADPAVEIEGLAPHRVERTYYLKNRYWLFVLLGKADPGPYTETFDARQECLPGRSCRDVMAEFTRAHRTQAADMGTVRRLRWMIDKIYLYRVDPWSEAKDPFEVAKRE